MDARVTEFLLDMIEELREELAARERPGRFLERALAVVGGHPAIPDRPLVREDLESLALCASRAAELFRDGDDEDRLLHVADHDVPRLLAEVHRLMALDESRRSGREGIEGDPVFLPGPGFFRAVYMNGVLTIEPAERPDHG